MATSADQIRIKIERAREHLRELQSEVKAYLDTNPYVIGYRRNPQTRRLFYHLLSVHDVPGRISAIAGDVLQNLRSALDHLAYALFNVGPGGTADCSATDICFPIFDDATKYERGSPRRVRGMKQDAIDAINSTKPYKDGNDTLWLLHTLNIIDKHRYLILVGSALQGVDVGAVVSHDFKAAFPQFDSMPILHTFFPPADRKFPLEVDDELYVDAQDAEVNNDMKYEFDVAIDEPGITEGEPLIKTLQDMVDLVDKLVTDFARLLT